jgi:hypothetical protein
MANEQLHYHELEPIAPEEAARALRSGDPAKVADALFRLALYSQDVQRVEELCVQHAGSPDHELRRMAALSLGTVARVHGAAFDGRRTFNKLLVMLEDPIREVRGQAEDALSDLRIFRWGNDRYSRERMVPFLQSNDIFDRYCAIFHVTRHDPDTTFAWEWGQWLLGDAHYAVRAAALWAVADIWDRLDRCRQADAITQVLHLLADAHRWVRETAQRVQEIIAPQARSYVRPQ